MLKKTAKLSWYSILLSGVCLLSACGGDSSNSPATTTPTIPETPVQPTLTTEQHFAKYLTELADDFIIPHYQKLLTDAKTQQLAAMAFCQIASPTQNDLNKVQNAWRQLNASWQQIAWLKLGAISNQGRGLRLQFWPDPNGAVARGVSALLLDGNEVTETQVANVNVGGQGLPALEYLYFNFQENPSLIEQSDKAKRCEVAQAISDNIVTIAGELVNSWQPAGDNFAKDFKEGTGSFTSQIDVVEEVVANWIEYLEVVKDRKLKLPLAHTQSSSTSPAEFVLSDSSSENIQINIGVFETLYLGAKSTGFDDVLIINKALPAINQQLIDAINAVKQQSTLLPDSLAQGVNTEQGRLESERLVELLATLRALLVTEFAQSLDLNLGFNGNDGD